MVVVNHDVARKSLAASFAPRGAPAVQPKLDGSTTPVMLRSTLRATARARLVQAAPRRLLATEGASAAAPTKSGVRSALVSTGLLALTGAGLYYAHDSQAGIHR